MQICTIHTHTHKVLIVFFCVIFFVAMGKQSARLMEKGYYDPEGNRKVFYNKFPDK